MAFERIVIHKSNVESALNHFKDNPDISEQDKLDMEEFIRLAKLGKINKKTKLCDSRCLKYIEVLMIPLSYFKKDSASLTVEEMERFDEDLTNDKIIGKKTKMPFAINTKIEIRKLFKIYLKWKLKNDVSKFVELTDWWDTTYKPLTPDYLSEKEVIALFDGCKNKSERFIVAVLFDTGARIQEFLNLRHEDAISPTESFPYYLFDFKTEYSKTKGRKIGLFWDKSEKAVKEYLDGKTQKNNEVIFDSKYDNIRKFLLRLGKRVLNKRVHPHLLRHASCTFYASRINRQELCIRYGWSFISRMPDVYIDRAGLDQNKIMESFKSQGMEKFKEENDDLRKKLTRAYMKLTTLETKFKQFKEDFDSFVSSKADCTVSK
ncbi:MAG: tyrosine-type recombinase/integrase [Candidatus Pacearchaeota archaeon]|jgi:integrase